VVLECTSVLKRLLRFLIGYRLVCILLYGLSGNLLFWFCSCFPSFVVLFCNPFFIKRPAFDYFRGYSDFCVWVSFGSVFCASVCVRSSPSLGGHLESSVSKLSFGVSVNFGFTLSSDNCMAVATFL
jgi:hypothetical protein